MSRASTADQIKTRLESHLKKDECTELHQAVLKDLNFKLLNLKKNYSKIDLYLSFNPGENESLFSEIVDAQFTRIPQQGKDLGKKVFNALNDAYQLSNLPVIIMGSNIPLLDINIFTEALAGLKERDLVIGPAADGGCYLIGMKEPKKFIYDFKDWGNSDILCRTIKEASKEKLKVHFLPEMSDIATFKELLQLRSKLKKIKLKNREMNVDYPENTSVVIEKIFAYK